MSKGPSAEGIRFRTCQPVWNGVTQEWAGQALAVFGEPDFRGTHAWLYPRPGDSAILTANGDVAQSGFFDEQWRLQ